MCVLIVIGYLTQDHCLQFPTPVVFKEVNVDLGFMSGIMGALEGGVVSVADPIYKKMPLLHVFVTKKCIY